jgi:hypothetical protein
MEKRNTDGGTGKAQGIKAISCMVPMSTYKQCINNDLKLVALLNESTSEAIRKKMRLCLAQTSERLNGLLSAFD